MKKGIVIAGVFLALSVGVAAVAVEGSRPFSPTSSDKNGGVSFSQDFSGSGSGSASGSVLDSISSSVSGGENNSGFGSDSAHGSDSSSVSPSSDSLNGSDSGSSEWQSSESADDSDSEHENGSASHLHDFIVINRVNSTCNGGGKIVYGCACGETYTDNTPALGHNYGSVDESDYIRSYKCSRCESVRRNADFSTTALKAKVDNSIADEIATAYEKVLDVINAASSDNYEEFERVYDVYISLIIKAEQNYRTLYALAAADADFSSVVNEAEVLRAKYFKAGAELFGKINDSVFSDSFYSEENGWSEQARQEALALCKLYGNNEYLTDCERADEIAKSLSPISTAASINELYDNRVENDKALAEFFGYDKEGGNDFIKYAYKERYARDYEPSETESVKKNIKTYIVPLFKKLYEEVQEAEKVYSFKGGETFYNSPKYSLAYSEYLKALDGVCDSNYYSQINSAFKNGCVLTGENVGAFTLKINKNFAISYFGKNNNDAFSLAHESGHAFCGDGVTEGLALDVAETAATLNESCFLAYITSDGCKVFTSDEKELIEKRKLLSLASVIISAAAIDDFEVAVYSDYYDGFESGITCENYELVFEGILAEYGVSELISENYWQNAAFNEGGYYFSYAVSSLAAMREYYLAKSGGESEAFKHYGDFLAKINGSFGGELNEGEFCGIKACANYFKDGRFKVSYLNALAESDITSPFGKDFYTIFSTQKS